MPILKFQKSFMTHLWQIRSRIFVSKKQETNLIKSKTTMSYKSTTSFFLMIQSNSIMFTHMIIKQHQGNEVTHACSVTLAGGVNFAALLLNFRPKNNLLSRILCGYYMELFIYLHRCSANWWVTSWVHSMGYMFEQYIYNWFVLL